MKCPEKLAFVLVQKQDQGGTKGPSLLQKLNGLGVFV